MEIYTSLNDLHGVAKCYCGMGIICGSMEEYQAALEYFSNGLENSKAAKRLELSATLTGNIGHVYFNFGQYQKAMDFFHEALSFYDKLNLERGAANMYGGIAGVHVYLGEFQLGLEMVQKAHDLHKKLGDDHGTAVSLMNLGIAQHKMGNLGEAETSLHKALDFCRSISLKSLEQQVIERLILLYQDLSNANQIQVYKDLFAEGMREEKRKSVIRKNEELKQRAKLQAMKKR